MNVNMDKFYAYYTIVPFVLKWAMVITLFVFAMILLNQVIKFVRLKNLALSKALSAKDTSDNTDDSHKN